MYQQLWLKFKIFFTRQSSAVRWTSVGLIAVVIFVGLFGVAHPVHAFDLFGFVWDNVAEMIANLFLAIASIIGKFLVVLIDILIGIVQYNDFVRSAAVNKGWVVVRDLCNMFFVAVLLIIAFGTILRIESYKYQRLLPQLIIMAVLINFSKLISGFLIDVSQVVLLTFVNAFKDTAAGNFVSVFQLKEMLGFIDPNAPQAASTLDNWQKIGLPFFAICLLLVAFFVILAMIVVFIARIVYLWVLIVLSPLAYLLAVVPMGKQYASRWWSTFGKWVTTGPVLAFFIWLSLSILTTSSGDPAQVVNLSGNQGNLVNNGLANAGLNAGLGTVSSSANLTGFIISVALLVMAMGFAQALGGFAGKWTGSMMGRMQKLGSGGLKVIGSPLKGGWELTKSGGRKLRREWRDSAVGKYTNISALMAGAKKRGEEVEKFSKDRAAARGEDLWDKRPKWMGGGADVVPAEMLVEARYERGIVGEVSKMQKEQKSAMLAQLWGRGGKQNEITRRAILASLAAEGHPDDALNTDFFRQKAEWVDRNGVKRQGFQQNSKGEYREVGRTYTAKELEDFDRGVASNSRITSDFFRATVSKGGTRSARAEDIETNAARTLYDLEELGKSAKHFEYAGDAGVDKRGELSTKEFDNKTGTFVGEINKQTDRVYIGSHPHNFSEIVNDEYGGERVQMRVLARDEELGEFTNFEKLASFDNDKSLKEFSATRLPELLGKFDATDKRMTVYDNPLQMQSLQRLYRDHGRFANLMEDKAGAQGYKMKRKDGSIQEFDDLEHMAQELGWGESSEYNKGDHGGIRHRSAAIAKAKKVQGTSNKEAVPTSGLVDQYGRPMSSAEQPVEDEKALEEKRKKEEAEEEAADLRDVSRQAYEATKAKAEEYKKQGMGSFFASAEYQKGVAGGQFLEQERFDEAQALEKYKAEHGTEGLRGVASYGAKGSSNVIGMDFSNLKVEGMDLSKDAGAFISDPAVLEKIKPQLIGMIDKEISEINAKPMQDRTPADSQRLKNLLAAKEKMNDEDAFQKLKLANLGRTGVGIRHVLNHEDMHDQLQQVDPDGKLQQQLWQEMSPEARRIATEQVKRKMTNQNMTEAQVMSEYFAEGMANAGPATRADRSPSAITLPPAALQRLAEKVREKSPNKQFNAPLEENIVIPQSLTGRDRRQAAKQAKQADKQQEKQFAQEEKMKAELKESEKALLASQQEARQKSAVFESAQKARKDVEASQTPKRRTISERARQLQQQAADEKALMDQASAKGDKAAAKQHQQNYNKLVPEISKAATELENLDREIAAAKRVEAAAQQGVRVAADQVKALSAKTKGKSDALESFKTGKVDATYANEKAQRDVGTLGRKGFVDAAGVAKVTNAIRQNDYQSAYGHMEDVKKQIEANPDAYSPEVAALREKIKNAQVSAQLTVGNKMSDVVKEDIAKWQNEIAGLTAGMTGQVDAIMKDMSSKIPSARDLYKSSPKEKIDELATKAVKPGVTQAEQQAATVAVQHEIENVAPPSTTVNKPEVQAPVNNIGQLLEQIKMSGQDDQTIQGIMSSLHKEIVTLSSALQGQQKTTDKFVKEITHPMAQQAHAGSLGQFGVNSTEWQKFMYNMNNLYKFFRDKSPKKSGEAGGKGMSSGSGQGPEIPVNS